MAVNSLFERETLGHLEALRHFALQLSKDEQYTNDLVQETMLKACRYFHTYKEGTNCRAWLFQICKNSYINDFRRKRLEPVPVDFQEEASRSAGDEGELREVRPMFADEPFSTLHAGLLSDEVAQALTAIPVDYQTAVILSDIEGHTYEEIADFMQSPIGTIRSRIHRGRRMLAEQLREYAHEQGYLSPAVAQ
jgi:RNA polymerase sigma-70 factor (ECF subfamily)